jgi:DNA-directed RNA polymerase I, II, and III subunit RPABC5
MKPIRCFTCNKILGNKWKTIERLRHEQVPYPELYERIGVTRYCCKKVIMTSVDTDECEHVFDESLCVSSIVQRAPTDIEIHKIKTSNGFFTSV